MKKGFTLIELLVVVLIIGILAAIALPQYTKAVERSRSAEAWTVLGDLANAERIHQMSTGQYTNNLYSLDLEFPNLSATSGVLTTNSFTVTVTPKNSNADVDIEATRDDGAYAGYKLKLALNQKGEITRTCTGEGSTGANGGICSTVASGVIKN